MCGLQFLKDIIIQGKDTFVKLVKAQTWCRVYCLCVSLSPRYISGWLGTRLGMRFVWLCICAFYFLHFLAKYERACCWLWTGLSTPKLCSFCLDLHLGIFRVHLASEIVWGEKTWKLFQQISTSTSSWSPTWDLLLASSLHNWAGLGKNRKMISMSPSLTGSRFLW